MKPALGWIAAAALAGTGLSGQTAHAQAQEVVWTGVVYASDEAASPADAKPPVQLAGFDQKLKAIFGYNHLRLLSEHREKMDDRKEHWLLPGKRFRICVDSKADPDGEYLLNLHLYERDRLLVQTRAKLGHHSPIFVRGPLCGKGQLVIVLLVE